MTTVSDLAGWLEQFAPAHLAEPWDNVGLLWGDPAAPVQRLMTCLTVTPGTAAEAIQEQASLIVSHHPVLFREVKRVRADLADTSHLWKLARAGIAIASPHTAFDNTPNGINDLLCRRLGLMDISPLRPIASGRHPAAGSAGPRSFKVVVFTPESDREAVMSGAVRGRCGPDRRLSGMLVRDPRPGDLLRDRNDRPSHWPAGSPRDGRRAAAGGCVPRGEPIRRVIVDPRGSFL